MLILIANYGAWKKYSCWKGAYVTRKKNWLKLTRTLCIRNKIGFDNLFLFVLISRNAHGNRLFSDICQLNASAFNYCKSYSLLFLLCYFVSFAFLAKYSTTKTCFYCDVSCAAEKLNDIDFINSFEKISKNTQELNTALEQLTYCAQFILSVRFVELSP